jgi:iron complex outermembrane receptor protein
LNLNLTESGNQNLQSEKLRDYEFGYRVMPSARLSFDLATFYGRYRDLSSVGLRPINMTFDQNGAQLNVPLTFENGITGHGYGAEIAAAWSVSKAWRLSGTYTRSRLFTNLTDLQEFQAGGGLQIPGIKFSPAAIQNYGLSSSLDSAIPPENQAGLQSYWDVTSKLSFDTGIYFVGAMDRINVPAFTRVDSQLMYALNPRFALRLSGQNLAEARHQEYQDAAQFLATRAPRSIFGGVIFQF